MPFNRWQSVCFFVIKSACAFTSNIVVVRKRVPLSGGVALCALVAQITIVFSLSTQQTALYIARLAATEIGLHRFLWGSVLILPRFRLLSSITVKHTHDIQLPPLIVELSRLHRTAISIRWTFPIYVGCSQLKASASL